MYDSATWFPICAGLTAVGVVAAFFALRRRGVASALRLLGWAVLPMALNLTGLVRLAWTIGSELVKWVTGFVFNPYVLTGLALFAFAAVALTVALITITLTNHFFPSDISTPRSIFQQDWASSVSTCRRCDSSSLTRSCSNPS